MATSRLILSIFCTKPAIKVPDQTLQLHSLIWDYAAHYPKVSLTMHPIIYVCPQWEKT